MKAFSNRNLVTAAVVALAAYGVTACIDGGALDAPADAPTVPDVTYDDVGSLSVASNFAVLGEFVGYVDPERGIFEVRMVDDLDEAGAVADELREAHQRTTVSDPTGWCRATVDRDGTAGTGATNTVEFYTPWGEIDKSIDECLTRIGDDGLSETSFPNGVLCADVIIRSFFTSDLENVYAEITSHNGESNQYGYAFPLGNGAERPDFGRNRPGLDFGLWSYGNLTTAEPEQKVVWTFKYGSTTPFTFGGRVIYSIAEDCDNGADDDCDGVADNACNEFLEGTTCIINDDCAGDSFCDGGALDSGAGDVDGACKCNTVDPPYHDSACSATCGDGTKNGAEVGADCGGPCDPCETKITASDAGNGDYFGDAVAIDGDRAVVGAREKNSQTGAAYVYERQTDGSWSQAAALTASDAAAGDLFGADVAIDGDRVVIGAPHDDEDFANSGSAYIFERQSDGSWTEVTKLLAADRFTDDTFGDAVSIDGDRVIVGAALKDVGTNTNAGAAYIFDRQTDGSWLETQKLTASDGAGFDDFGTSVSISGDRAIIGAPKVEVSGITDAGSAYVFERQSDGTWSEAQKLSASDPATEDWFGRSVSIDGDRAVIGAPLKEAAAITNAGAAYIFERASDTGSWVEVTTLFAHDGELDDEFANSVSISGDRVIGGAALHSATATNSGAAYVFERQTDGSWPQTDQLVASDAGNFDDMGVSVAIDGDRAIAGAWRDDHSTLTDPGSAYIFEF